MRSEGDSTFEELKKKTTAKKKRKRHFIPVLSLNIADRSLLKKKLGLKPLWASGVVVGGVSSDALQTEAAEPRVPSGEEEGEEEEKETG